MLRVGLCRLAHVVFFDVPKTYGQCLEKLIDTRLGLDPLSTAYFLLKPPWFFIVMFSYFVTTAPPIKIRTLTKNI